MANYSTLKAAVADVVKTNGTQAITGANLQAVLLSIINSVGGGGYIFAGVATPSTDAGTPDQNVFYVGGAGTYANFGTSVTVPVGSIGVFKYNGSWTNETITMFAGIDDVPTGESDNLVKSGGVYPIAQKVNDCVFGDYNPKWEIGNISISDSGWSYSASTTKVRLKQGETIYLYAGDEIQLLDHDNERMYIGWKREDGTYGRTNGWTQSDFAALENGQYVILLSNVPEATVSSVDDLVSNIKLVSHHKYYDLISENRQNIMISSGKYEYEIYVKKYGEHASTIDLMPINYKAGTTITGKISQGSAVSTGAYTMVYLRDANNAAVGYKNITLGQEFTYSINRDAQFISFYIYSVTTLGTFKVELEYHPDDEIIGTLQTEVTSLKANKGAVCYLLAPGNNLPDISTTTRTLTIKSGFLLTFNKTEYHNDQSDIVVDLSAVASGAKKVIYDNSNHTFSCIQYSTALTDTQGVVMLIRTDYNASGLFTKVFSYSCTCECTIDGDRLISKGNIAGTGSINLQSKFFEKLINIPVTSSLFDTTIYSVGNQSCAIYGDYCVFVRNATLRADSNQQKYGIVIVNLTNFTNIGEFVVNLSNTKAHGNNMSLGAKYSNDDTLPLLYISSTYSPSECNVIRVSNSFDTYTLIQSIKYVGSSHFQNTIDWIVDGDYIWAYGSVSGSLPSIEFVKFQKPSISSSNIELSDTDVIDSFIVENLNIAQGAFIYNDRIYIGLGYSANDEYIKVIDIVSHKVISVVPISYEPEGLTIYNDKVCVCRSIFALYTYQDGV